MREERKEKNKKELNDDPPSIDLIWQTVLDHSNRLSKIEGSLSTIKWVVGTFIPIITSLIIYILTIMGA